VAGFSFLVITIVQHFYDKKTEKANAASIGTKVVEVQSLTSCYSILVATFKSTALCVKSGERLVLVEHHLAADGRSETTFLLLGLISQL
jgi:hypothetical protein